jgi:dUTP pyrophosphatase
MADEKDAKEKVQDPAPRGPEVVQIAWSRIRDEEVGKEPNKHYPSDVGYDLVCSRYTPVSSRVRAQIPTNIAVAIPEGFFGLVLPRSSTFHRRGLISHPGIIDSGYRGEVMFMVYNPGQKQVHVADGERLAQLVILPIVDVDFKEERGVKKLPKGDRGDKGFGSTGGFNE